MTTTAPAYLDAANIIWGQLGRARVMIGAKNPLGGKNEAGDAQLTFKIGGNGKKVTHIRITLCRNDTYHVEFLRATMRECKVLAAQEMVYADQLLAVIETNTALRTSL